MSSSEPGDAVGKDDTGVLDCRWERIKLRAESCVDGVDGVDGCA